MKLFFLNLISLFVCFLTINSFAQEFIPVQGLNSDDWGYYEMGSMNREKMMPYHIAAIKKNGISKEYHLIDQDTVAIFIYSSKGLLTKSVINAADIFAKQSFEFSFNEDDKLVGVICKAEKATKLSGYTRDSSGQINSIWSRYPAKDSIQFNFIYAKGKLTEAGDYKLAGDRFLHKTKKTDVVIAYDLNGREILSNRDGGLRIENSFDRQGRWIQNRYTYIFERDQLYSITDISYKNDLMQKIVERYPNVYAYGDSGLKNSTETQIKYESDYLTKK
ncbi:hypothetical protein MASR1M107_18960 [Ignavibacteriales bacterium]